MLRHLKPARFLLIDRQVLKDIFQQTLQLYGITSVHRQWMQARALGSA